MIVKINGELISTYSIEPHEIKIKWNPKNKKLKKIAITLWTISGSIMLTNVSYAASNSSIWNEMQPVFHIFQDIAMIVGALAILAGLIVMVFKKQIGWRVVSTSGLVVLGCFLVPAAVMLVAIIGQLLNETLLDVFQKLNIKDSVKVGG